MRVLKAIGSGIRNFFILFSFIVNLVLVLVIIGLVLLIFDIKNNVVTPLITGLHSSFVGLDESTIDWTIPVRDRIPVVLNIPLNTNTVVRLTEAVPLQLNATITLPGVGVLNNAIVNLSLPEGTPLNVNLDLNVPVDEMLDIALDVRAVIPINQTQLHDPINNLRLTFEPIARALYNLPGNWDETIAMVNEITAGGQVDLLAENNYSRSPWPGYGQTAGVGYTLSGEAWPSQNVPLETGIVEQGGIPALDQGVRPNLYAADANPDQINAQARAQMASQGIEAFTFDGTYAQVQGMPLLMLRNAQGGPTSNVSGTGENTLDPGVFTGPPTPMSPELGAPVALPTAQTLSNIVVPQVTPLGPDGQPLPPPTPMG